jgi:alcohol dehydrogenase
VTAETRMNALVFDETLALKRIPKPIPRAGEALVKVRVAGICKTDTEITKGYMGFRGVLGHEFVGTVTYAPDPTQVGLRVTGEINAGCGECSWCREGMERHCPHRTVLGILGRDGAFAEYLSLPVGNLVPVPEGLPDHKAVFVEPVAAALEILEQVKIKPADRVLVIGDGKLGLLVCMALRLTGCDLRLVGKHPEKMAIFERMGGIAVLRENLASDDRPYDVVVEASGNRTGWDLAMSHLKPRGILVLKSTYHAGFDFNPAPLVINEIHVVGSRCGKFAPALRLMDLGLIDPIPLISETVPFDRIEEVFQRPATGRDLKILVTIFSEEE